MSPDPCDAREAGDDLGFTLPCRCGAAVRAESLALRNEALLAQLARAHGKTVEAERVAQGPVSPPLAG